MAAWVIDADSHVTESPDVWTARVPRRYGDLVPHVVRDGDTGEDVWFINGERSSAMVGGGAVAGWKEPYPEVALGPGKITEQYVFGGLWTAIGLAILGYWAQQVRRVLKIDDAAVTSPAGTRVPFESITGLGLKKWDSKGLATVKYQVDGRAGSFVVDDYKYDTEPAREIPEEIKRRLEARAAASQQPAV